MAGAGRLGGGDGALEVAAGGEARRAPGGDLDRLAGARVACLTGAARGDREAPEAGDRDLPAGGQLGLDRGQRRLEGPGGLAVRQARAAGDLLDELALGHAQLLL